MSGTRIQSDVPVNVYSGNIRALVVEVEDPNVGNINSGSRDHLIEQLLPVSRWGTQFHVEPIPDRRFGMVILWFILIDFDLYLPGVGAV